MGPSLLLSLLLLGTGVSFAGNDAALCPGGRPSLRSALARLRPARPSSRILDELFAAGVRRRGFKVGGSGTNDIFELESPDPFNPLLFPDRPDVPARLRGRKVDGFLLKEPYKGLREIMPGTSVPSPALKRVVQARDRRMRAAIEQALQDPLYEGIRIADTVYLEGEDGGPQRILQEKVGGKGLTEVTTPMMKDIMGVKYSPEGAQELFQVLIGPDTVSDPHPHVFDRLFKERYRQYLDPFGGTTVAHLHWVSKDMKRIRSLIGKLRRLHDSPIIAAAQAPYEAEGGQVMINRPPWSPIAWRVAADFTEGNFRFLRDENGEIYLKLIDW